MTDNLDLPFDQFQRYELVRVLVEDVRRDGETLRILDVGGRTALLREFLPDDRVELVDVVPSDAEGLVLGSGAELPFQDDSFDVVCGFDTLEHVPPPLRRAFVSECARVANRYVMLAGPYDAPRVAEAEQILLDFLKVRLEWEHRYLAEHRENGLPDMDETRSVLEEAGARVEAFGHGALDRWLALMSLELYVEHEHLLRHFAKRVYRFYNEHVFRTDHGPEVYRHAVVAAFGDAPMPSLDSALDPPGSAPAEATGTFADLSREILRYDALRDTYQPEMERLHGVVERAEKNLAGHRETLADVESDLAGHRETVAALRAELESERAATQSMAAAKDEQIGGLTADLEGTRATVAELERLRAGELRELELRAERLDEANRLLAEQNDKLVDAFAQLEARVQVEKDLRAEIAGLEDQNAELRRKHAALAEEAMLRWSRLGRKLARRELDPDVLEAP